MTEFFVIHRFLASSIVFFKSIQVEPICGQGAKRIYCLVVDYFNLWNILFGLFLAHWTIIFRIARFNLRLKNLRSKENYEI